MRDLFVLEWKLMLKVVESAYSTLQKSDSNHYCGMDFTSNLGVDSNPIMR